MASLLLPFSLHPPFFHPSLLTAQLKPILALLAALQRAPLARCPHSVSSGPPTPPASGPGPDPPRSMSTWQAEETNTNFPSSLIPGRLPCLPQLGWPHHPLGEPAQVSPVASTVTSLGLCSCSSDQCWICPGPFLRSAKRLRQTLLSPDFIMLLPRPQLPFLHL